MPESFEGYMLDDAAMEKWATVMKLRQDVNGVLEKARADKRIGKALEARVTVFGDETVKNATDDLNMAEICIVSACEWAQPEEGAEVGTGVNFPGLTIGVSEAQGAKCPRCWMHTLSSHAEGLCARCESVVAKLDVEI
jgi:isoleucyl-tRNA synthetase